MASSVAKLREELLHLTGGKLDIQLDEKNFKSSFQILKELSEIWDEIGEKAGDITQANILNLLGGKRNANVLSSIITNFQDAIDASETASNSMGSAWRENEKYLDSIEGKTKQMQASFETFATTVLNSGVVKAFVDLQKTILNVATALSKVGALVPTLAGIGIIIKTIKDNATANKTIEALTTLIKNGGGMDKAVQAFNSLTPNVQKLVIARGGEAIKEIGENAGYAAGATHGLSGAFETLNSKVTGLGGALKSLLSNWAVWLTAISLIISGIRALINAQKEAREQAIENAKEQKRLYEEAKSTYDQNVESLESLRGEYDKLSKGVDSHGRNISLTAEEYERYLSIVKRVVDISPDVADGFNKEGAQLAEYTDLIDKAIDKEKELLDLQRQAMISKGESLFEGWNESVSDINDEYTHLFVNLREATGGNLTGVGIYETDKMAGEQARLEAFRDVLKGFGIDYAQTVEQVRDSEWSSAMSKDYDFMLKVYDAWKNGHLIEALKQTGAYNDDELGAVNEAIRAFAQIIPQYKELRDSAAEYLEAGFEEWSLTEGLYDELSKTEGALEKFKRGIIDIAKPEASLQENRQALLEYAEAFVEAIGEVQEFEDYYTDPEHAGELFDRTWFNAILEKYRGMPQIIKYIAEAEERMKASTSGADEELRSMTDDTEKLFELLGKMSSLETFVSDTNAQKPLKDMLNALGEFKDLYNSITGKEISDSDLFKDDQWQVGRINTYINEMVEAVTANNSFVESNPALLASLLNLASALGTATNATVSFGDAMDAVNSVSNLKKSIDDFVAAGADAGDAERGELLSSLDNIISKWNEIRQAQAEASGEEFVALKHEDFLGADMNDWDLAKKKILEYKAAVITLFALGEGAGQNELVNIILGLDTATQGATKSTYKLADAISALGDAQGYAENGFDLEDPAKAISNAEKLAEEWNNARKKMGLDGDKTWKDILSIETSGADGVIAALSEREGVIKSVYTDIVGAFIETVDATDDEKEALKNGLIAIFDGIEVDKSSKKIKDAFTQIGEAYTFMSDHIAGERVGSIEEVYDDLAKLMELTGDKTLKLTDFIDWDEDLGDFVYKTNTLETVIDDAATTIATEMVDAEIEAGNAMEDALRTDEINKRANAIKRSLEGVIDTWGQLTSVVGNVKNMQSLKSDYNSYMSGDMSFLDMLSSTISLAEDLGISLDDAFSIGADGEMVVNIKNMENGLIGVIDNLEKSGECSANLAEQLRQAVRAEAELESGAEKIQKAYDKAREGISAGQNRQRGQQLTFEDYKSMIERDARYADTVEYVNGVMSINRDLYNETTAAIAGETAQMALLEAAQRKLKIDKLQKELDGMENVTQDVIDAHKKEIEKLKLEAKGYTILANEISNATNQFERFRNAAGEADDETYMDAQSALKMIEDVMYNVESEFYGRVGNEKFKEAIRLLIDPEFDFEKGDLQAAVAEAYATLRKYFGQGDEDNPQTSRGNMNTFFNDLLEAGFASTKVDEAGRKWGELNGTVSDIAKTFGLTDDAVRAALNELEEFSQVGFNWKEIDPEYFQRLKADADELAKAIDEADQKAAKVSTDAEKARKEADEAAERLERAQKLSEGEDLSGLEQAAKEADEKAKALEDAAKSAKQAAEELHGAQEESSTEKLRKSLEELVEQIEKLTSEPIELDFGSTLESTKEVADELFRMAELLDQMNAINASMAEIGETTDATHGKVDELGDESVDINTAPAQDSLGRVIDVGWNVIDMVEEICSMFIDLDPNPAIDSIQAVIDSLEVLAEAVNDVNKLSLSTANTKKSSTTVTQYASGTDSAKGGKSLVGELGREMVVDVNSGRWYTVGNNGPEFVNLPKRAVVFNHEKTAELLGDTPIKLHGRAFASGTGNLAGTYNNSSVGGGMINIVALNTPEKQKETKKATAAYQEEVDTIESLAEAYKLANEQLEHLIKHEEQNYYIAERAANFDKMHTYLANEVEIYKKIMENSQRGIDALKAAGADDGNEELQGLEEAYWSAYRSMYEALDNIRSLYSDALGEEVDDIQSAYKNLTNAVKEYNDTGLISIDTFQAILDNGIEYLGLLQDENGMFDVSTNAVRDLLKYRKDQLAVETAIAYVSRLNEALKNGESQKVAELVNATGQIGRNTWDIVYANLELLKTQGLSDELYQTALDNIDKLRDLTDVTMDDFISEDAIEEAKERFDELNKQIEHYIAHQKFAYDVGERGMDFTAMNTALSNEVEYYKQIMDEAQKTIAELTMLGADDTNEALQSVEESYWSAYRSMYSALDSIRKLRVDALSDRLDSLTGAFGTLKKAADEYSKSGGISLDTLESLLSNGFQYMSLLDAQDGKYVINTERVNAYVNARKNQLAVENALSYISEVREAIENKESDRLQHLVDSMDAVTNSTWDYVYAQAALLKASMSGAQYDAFIANIDKMRTLADSVVYDYASGAGEVTEEYDKQSEALGDILKYTEDLIRAETKDKIDALNDQIEAYKKIIDLKKESIDKTKDENEYQEEVADRVKEIAELQAKADLLGLDTSRTASAERQKLLQDIADKQKDLAKYQQDYSIDAQKEALDKDLEAYEEQKKAEIEELEKTISSEEKVYQLAIARIRDQWETLYADLIAWNTEEGSVINQEITEAWEAATRAVEKYGSAIRAMEAIKQAESGDNLVVADIRKYHSGGIVGDQGSLNEKEVLAVLEKGEVVVTKPMKQALYTAVDFVHELGKRLGVKLDSIRNFTVGDLGGAFIPALAGAGSVPMTQNNNISFSPVFNVEFNGADIGNRDARTLGREIASAAADNLFDAFSKRGIDTLRTLRQ